MPGRLCPWGGWGQGCRRCPWDGAGAAVPQPRRGPLPTPSPWPERERDPAHPLSAGGCFSPPSSSLFGVFGRVFPPVGLRWTNHPAQGDVLNLAGVFLFKGLQVLTPPCALGVSSSPTPQIKKGLESSEMLPLRSNPRKPCSPVGAVGCPAPLGLLQAFICRPRSHGRWTPKRSWSRLPSSRRKARCTSRFVNLGVAEAEQGNKFGVTIGYTT